MDKRLLLASPHMSDEGYELEYIHDAFQKNWIAPLGENVNEFEKAMGEFMGKGYPVALSAGTAALHLAMILAGVKTGDTVFCQSLTFSASANPVAYCGAKPVFIDSERETGNMDPAALRRAFALHGTPKAVVVVHLYGNPAKLDEITAICREHDVPLIEDAAEALGSTYNGQKCGTFGNFGALSFNGNKIITTSGGGMLLCRTEDEAKHALKLSTQARENAPWYQHEEIGYNYRMSNICAGIGRGQMKVLALRVRQKQAIFKRYCEQLRDLPISMLNGAIMFDGLFGTANYFARLANYFLIFQSLSLPWMLKKIGGRDGKVLTILMVLGYAAYFYYANAINQPFDHYFARLSLAEYFAQIGR